MENTGLDNNIVNEEVCDKQQGVLYEYSQKHAIKMAKKEKRKGIMQFIKYALCAASAGIIQMASFAILQAVIPATDKTIHFLVEDMEIVTFISTTVALCLSILWNFTLNRKFTFKDASNVPKAMILAFLFYVPFFPFQTWYVHTVKTGLAPFMSLDLAGIIAEATVMICNFALEFLWQKFVVFRKKKPKENKEAQVVDAQNQDSNALDDVNDDNSYAVDDKTIKNGDKVDNVSDVDAAQDADIIKN